MRAAVTVREYARLTTEPLLDSTLDRAQISASAFEWLCELSSTFTKAGAALVQLEGRRWLRLDNYVGVVETPCGTRIEILPKHYHESDDIRRSRALLCRMIGIARDLPTRAVGTADVQIFDVPLNEWVIREFLQHLDDLIKRGVRFDYHRVEDEQRFLRGQLDMTRQIRQPPARRHYFNIRHDLFLPDRPENRLLKLAVDRVCKATEEPESWRLAQELRSLMSDIPASRDVDEDFSRWSDNRLMAHYRPVKPWCELILNNQTPMAVAGNTKGISLLFPMEKVFERYVAAWLRKSRDKDTRLVSQAAEHHLCQHDGGKMFRLEPDLLLRQGDGCWVLDTKWKRLNGTDKKGNYGLSQADFYQLFAYGQKYLANQRQGEMVLIYPKHPYFDAPLPGFSLTEALTLWVLPFDLEAERLDGLELTSLPVQAPGHAPLLRIREQ